MRYLAPFLVVALVFLGCVLLSSPAQNVVKVRPLDFEIETQGDWVIVDQKETRRLFVRRAAVSSLAFYEAGKGLATLYDHPIVIVVMGSREFRFDCKDAGDAARLVDDLTAAP